MLRSLFVPIVLVSWLLAEVPAQAYLDPGSGSMLLQVLLGGFAAVAVIGKLYWHRVRSFFGKNDPSDRPTNPRTGA